MAHCPNVFVSFLLAGREFNFIPLHLHKSEDKNLSYIETVLMKVKQSLLSI